MAHSLADLSCFKRGAFLLILLAVQFEAGTAMAQTTVRGQILQGSAPIRGVKVSLLCPPAWHECAYTYSGPDGMYYLQGIPPGTYALEVWAGTPQRFSIEVPPRPWADVAPIQVR